MGCEYLEEDYSFFKDELLDKYKFDYLVASAHYYPYMGEWASGWVDVNSKKELYAYCEYLVQMMSTGLFDFVAHPDMFGASYEFWDSEAIACSRYIFEAAKEYNVALEINANGFRKGVMHMQKSKRYMYPLESFWQLACEYDINVTVNSDAHLPNEIVSRVKDAILLAEKYNLRIIEYPDFCNRRGNKYKFL